jgi:hypothetical protein
MPPSLTFSPSQSLSDQLRNAQAAALTDTAVLSLFGQADSTAQYAIHEEDRLEWLHALLTDAASLPDWLAYELKNRPILFIGREVPSLFFLRMVSNTRLSLERKQFFFVGSHEPSLLSSLFATYCRQAQGQQLDMEPTMFVAELRRRWEEDSAGQPVSGTDRPPSARRRACRPFSNAVVCGSGTTGLHTVVSTATLHGPSSRCRPMG